MTFFHSLLSLDTGLFRSLNGLAGQHPVMDVLMIVWAQYAPIGFALLLIALWLTWRPAYQRGAFLAGGASLLALGVGQLIGMALPRLRPFEAPGLGHVTLLIPHTTDTSFPSDHATLAFAVTAALWAVDRRLGVLSLVLAAWVSVARVYVGVHYPSDVVGGAVLGAGVSGVVLWLAPKPPLRPLLDALLSFLHRVRLAASPGSGTAG